MTCAECVWSAWTTEERVLDGQRVPKLMRRCYVCKSEVWEDDPREEQDD